MHVSASAGGVITIGDVAASLAETQTIHDVILDSTCHFRHKDVSCTLCPKKTTLMLHTIDSTHINRFR